jgi:MFS-type transporter involved in bile tolerance (Atg22 family)
MLGGSRRYAILLAGATAALGSAGLAFLPIDTPTPVLGVAVLVCAVGAIGWNGVQISLLSELAAPGAEGRAVGMGIMLQQPGMLIGPFLFGLVVDASGSFRAAWLLLVAYFVLAILVISAVREAPRSSSDGRLKL